MEDPTFVVERHPTSNETVIRGLGEIHLKSKLAKMAAQYKLEVDTQPPRIPYRETITGNAEAMYRHKKQSGGSGQFGEVHLRIEPFPEGDFEFTDELVGMNLEIGRVNFKVLGMLDAANTGAYGAHALTVAGLDHIGVGGAAIEPDVENVVDQAQQRRGEELPREREHQGHATLPGLLDHFPAAAEVYENLQYAHAGLCRAPLEMSLQSELAARELLARVSRPGA